MTFAVFDPSPR